TLAVGTDRGVLLRDIASGRVDYLPGTAVARQLEYTGRNGLVILNGGGRAAFWDLMPGPPVPIGDPAVAISSLAVSQDGKVVALGGDRLTELWDAAARRVLRTLPKDQPGSI